MGIGMLFLSCPASSQRNGDGLYGRWDRALTLDIGAGPAVSWIQQDTHVSVASEMRLLVADMGGIAVAGRWAPTDGQYLFVGVDLRPLFPALFFLYLSTWNAFSDLLIQSLYLEIGPTFLLDGKHSVGLGVGFGLSVPLYRPLKTLRGIWLRLGARHVNVTPEYYNTPNSMNQSEWTVLTTLTIRLGIKSHIIGRQTIPGH